MSKELLATFVPTLGTWENCRLKIVVHGSLPNFKRVVALFPGPVVKPEVYLLQLR